MDTTKIKVIDMQDDFIANPISLEEKNRMKASFNRLTEFVKTLE